MKQLAVVSVILMILVGIGLFISGLLTGDDVATGYFSGKDSFDTEAEYTQFKTALALTDWNLENVDELHSEPPILVQFSTNDKTHSFPYGVEEISKEGNLALAIPGFVLMVLGLLIIASYLGSYKEVD